MILIEYYPKYVGDYDSQGYSFYEGERVSEDPKDKYLKGSKEKAYKTVNQVRDEIRKNASRPIINIKWIWNLLYQKLWA